MKANPWLDRALPPDVSADMIRIVFNTVFDKSPQEQQQYMAEVMLTLRNCPSDLKQRLQEIAHG